MNKLPNWVIVLLAFAGFIVVGGILNTIAPDELTAQDQAAAGDYESALATMMEARDTALLDSLRLAYPPIDTLYMAAQVAEADQHKQDSIKAAQRLLEELKEERASNFAGSDQRNYYLNEVIKQMMNDPDSFEHDRTTFSQEGSVLRVRCQFRGRNALGGVVRQVAIATMSASGDRVIQIDFE